MAGTLQDNSACHNMVCIMMDQENENVCVITKNSDAVYVISCQFTHLVFMNMVLRGLACPRSWKGVIAW